MARKDIHRPSALNPEDYEFVAHDYYGPDNMGMSLSGERAAFREHMARTGGKFSGHDHGGSCHVCGAGAMYVAKFWHKPSNAYIVTGEDCAAKMHMGDPAAFRRFRDKVGVQREAIAGKRKAEKILIEAGLGKAWELLEASVAKRKAHAEAYKEWQNAGGGDEDSMPKYPEYSRDEDTALDIVSRLIKYGNISDKAVSFLGQLLERIEQAPEIAAEKAAAKALEMANAKPVPVVEGRVLVKGEVLTVKEQEGFYGIQIKMLVKAEDGFKLWGTVPSALIGEVEKGSMIEFNAKIQRSDDDEYFGFFSRPSKAKVIKALASCEMGGGGGGGGRQGGGRRRNGGGGGGGAGGEERGGGGGRGGGGRGGGGGGRN